VSAWTVPTNLGGWSGPLKPGHRFNPLSAVRSARLAGPVSPFAGGPSGRPKRAAQAGGPSARQLQSGPQRSSFDYYLSFEQIHWRVLFNSKTGHVFSSRWTHGYGYRELISFFFTQKIPSALAAKLNVCSINVSCSSCILFLFHAFTLFKIRGVTPCWKYVHRISGCQGYQPHIAEV